MISTRVWAFSLITLSIACGGAVEGTDGQEHPDPTTIAQEQVTKADAAPPHEPHFLCQLSAPAAVQFLDCSTTDDGGPSYTDVDGIDCRKYVAGAGQGCIPPMACQATIDGQTVDGVCVDAP